MTKKAWLKCEKCGVVDKTDYSIGHVGTSTVMRCPDCKGDSLYAKLCRNCCPTGHGTRFTE